MELVPLDQIPVSAFADQVNGSFAVVVPNGQAVELILTSVSQPRIPENRGGGDAYESFSLFFQGPGSSPLGQGRWVLRNHRLGCFELFIVPIGNAGGFFQYQAAFTRIR